MNYQAKISTNLPMHGLDKILRMKKESQMAGPIATGAAPAASPASAPKVAPPAAPSAPSKFTPSDPGQLLNQQAGQGDASANNGLGPGGALIQGFVPNPHEKNKDAKIFFRDNKISENGMYGPFDIKGKKLYYPVKFNRNTQQFEFVPLGRAIESP